MPQEVYDINGNKIEVPTAEEIQAEKDAATDAARAEVEKSFATDKEKSAEEFSKIQEDLKKLQEKDLNFQKIREKTTEQEKEQERNKQEIEKVRNELQQKNQQLENFVVGNTKKEIINEIAGGDAEIAEAIEANYGRIVGPESTKDEILTRAKEAYGMTLIQNGIDPLASDTMGNAMTSTSGRAVGAPKASEVSQGAKDLGKRAFGLTDKDFDQHLK